ncbi:NUDIX hydrolase [Cellulomonas sp. APG4]|nr:NUDIX hydrolase [Cellulomonas sp. APG4]
MRASRVVYHWEGPPRVELVLDDVERGGRRWAQHRLVLADGRPGAVAVVVRDDQVLLVRQWRPAVGRVLWELPRGLADAGDADGAATAAREVHEETGLPTASARVLGTVWPDSGLLAGTVAVVEVHLAPTGPDASPSADGEVDARHWVPVAQLDELVREGTLTDGLSLAALAVWRASR